MLYLIGCAQGKFASTNQKHFQIRVLTHHQYGSLTFFLTHHSSGLPVVAMPKVSCILRLTQIHFISRLSMIVRINVVLNKEEKSLRHVPMGAKFLDDNKPKIHLKNEFALFQA